MTPSLPFIWNPLVFVLVRNYKFAQCLDYKCWCIYAILPLPQLCQAHVSLCLWFRMTYHVQEIITACSFRREVSCIIWKHSMLMFWRLSMFHSKICRKYKRVHVVSCIWALSNPKVQHFTNVTTCPQIRNMYRNTIICGKHEVKIVLLLHQSV